MFVKNIDFLKIRVFQNFGPSLSKEYSVLELVRTMSWHWRNVSWEKVSKSKKKYFESGLLRLNCKKANKFLKWKTVLKFDELMGMVADWYKYYYLNKKNALKMTSKQIKKYQSLATRRGMHWAKI